MPHIFMLMPVLGLLLFVFLPWQVAVILYVPIAIGSLIIARKVMQAQREPPVSGREAPIVLYCRSGSMSTTAAKVLADEGYSNVMELDGGFSAWKAQGYELLDKR
jgi:rhodanese-related sulfurtransferase